MQSTLDLIHVRRVAEDLARQAGAVLLARYGQPHDHQSKRTLNDIVTEGDKAAEDVLLAGLHQYFPDHAILSEEGGGAAQADSPVCWHLDPLDGTSNYASNLPLFAVSMALSDRDLQPLVGVVYAPVLDELFSAHRGGGATLNGAPIQVSTTDALADAMLVTGFPYISSQNPEMNLPEWRVFTRRSRSIRRFGTIALELCYVACGRFDGQWEAGVNSWDVQAGLLILDEAGGQASDYHGAASEALYRGAQVVSSNGRLHAAMLEALAEA